jgi:hypothetical protein
MTIMCACVPASGTHMTDGANRGSPATVQRQCQPQVASVQALAMANNPGSGSNGYGRRQGTLASTRRMIDSRALSLLISGRGYGNGRGREQGAFCTRWRRT